MTINPIHTDHNNHHHQDTTHHHHSQHQDPHIYQAISHPHRNMITQDIRNPIPTPPIPIMKADPPPTIQGIGNTIIKTMKNTINNHNTTTIGNGIEIVKGELVSYRILCVFSMCCTCGHAFSYTFQKQFLFNIDSKAESASVPSFSSSYGGRRPLSGSYLLDRETNDPQKAVNNEKSSNDGSMAMAQTMDQPKDEKKE